MRVSLRSIHSQHIIENPSSRREQRRSDGIKQTRESCVLSLPLSLCRCFDASPINIMITFVVIIALHTFAQNTMRINSFQSITCARPGSFPRCFDRNIHQTKRRKKSEIAKDQNLINGPTNARTNERTKSSISFLSI